MATIGIIGAGQLGQMLGIAGRRLGLDFVYLDPGDSPPAASEGPVLQFPFDSDEGLQALASRCDVLTYEFENVPVAAVERLAGQIAVYPPPAALRHAQDRLSEKRLFESLGIPVPPYRSVDSLADLDAAIANIGLPVVLKTRRLGYDGKGQRIVRSPDEGEAAVTELGGSALIAEQWVPFDREVSAIGARGISGEIAHYPLTENVHTGGILDTSRAPADGISQYAGAVTYLTALMEKLDYAGVMALEMFVVGNRLLANEFAPRVHNSGHWTIEGAETSQFENHLRAILDMPLGSTRMRGFAGMLNLVGTIPDDRSIFDAAPSHLHDYGKSTRPGRKLGHATVVAGTAAERDRVLKRLIRQTGA